MQKTDRQTDKTTRWAFTMYEDQYHLLDTIDKNIVKMIKYQDEICPDTQRKHKQGCILTHQQQRFSAMVKMLPGVHLEKAKNWTALLNYCEKSESRDVSGSQVTINYDSYAPKKLHDLLTEFAQIYNDITNKECMLCMQMECNCSHMDRTADPDYWEIARVYLTQNPELCGIVGQPLPQNLWKNTRSVWIKRAIVLRSLIEISPESQSRESIPGENKI